MNYENGMNDGNANHDMEEDGGSWVDDVALRVTGLLAGQCVEEAAALCDLLGDALREGGGREATMALAGAVSVRVRCERIALLCGQLGGEQERSRG